MKRIGCLFICIISSCIVLGQTTTNKLDLQDSVRVKLSTDTASYNQFIMLGKCKCSDLIDSTANYTAVYDELYSLWTPFTRIVGSNTGKKKLEAYLTAYINSKVQEELDFLKENDEIVRSYPNSIILCNRIFSKKDLWSVYLNFIRQENLFYGLEHHLREYLLPDSPVISNKGW